MLVLGEARDKAWDSTVLKFKEQVIEKRKDSKIPEKGIIKFENQGDIVKNADGSYTIKCSPPTDLVGIRLIIEPQTFFNSHDNKSCLHSMIDDHDAHVIENIGYQKFWRNSAIHLEDNYIKLLAPLDEYIDKAIEILEKTKKLLSYNDEREDSMLPFTEAQYEKAQKNLKLKIESTPSYLNSNQNRLEKDPQYKKIILKRLNLLRRLQLTKIHNYLISAKKPEISKYKDELKAIIGENNYPDNPQLDDLIMLIKIKLASKEYEYSSDTPSSVLAQEFLSRTLSLSYEDYKKYILKLREESISKKLKATSKEDLKWKPGEIPIPKFIISNKPKLEQIDSLIDSYKSLKRQAKPSDSNENREYNEALLNREVRNHNILDLKEILKDYKNAYEERYAYSSSTALLLQIFNPKQSQTGRLLNALGAKASTKSPKILVRQNGLYTFFFFVDTPFGTMEFRLDTVNRYDIQKNGTAAHSVHNKPPTKINFDNSRKNIEKQLSLRVPRKFEIAFSRDGKKVTITSLTQPNSYIALLQEICDTPEHSTLIGEAKMLEDQTNQFITKYHINNQNPSENFDTSGTYGIIEKIKKALEGKNIISKEEFEKCSDISSEGITNLLGKYVSYLIEKHPNPPPCFGKTIQSKVTRAEINKSISDQIRGFDSDGEFKNPGEFEEIPF